MSPILDDPRGTFTGNVPTVYPPNVPTVHPPTFGRRPTLNLGVILQPYRNAGVTTGDVANWLEEDYGVMETFSRVHWRTIETALQVSMQNAIEGLFMGRRVDPWGAGTQQIQQKFRDFINSGEAERVGIPGTPTQAALRGVNHRRKHPYGRGRPHHPQPNPRRPSFRDTGLYVASFRSWVT